MLGLSLKHPLKLEGNDLGATHISDYDTGTIEAFIVTIAHSNKLRAVARLLPFHLAEMMMNTLQWVSN